MAVLNGYDSVELMGRSGRGKKFGRAALAVLTGGMSSKKFRRGLAAVSTGGMSEVARKAAQMAKARKAAASASNTYYNDTSVNPEYQDEVAGIEPETVTEEYTDVPESQETELSGDNKKLLIYGAVAIGTFLLYKHFTKRK